ncbi:hypothetical protein ACJ8B1_27415 [Klebsiella pneumoniae]
MKKDLLLEPRNLAAAVRARLDEIEGLLDKGISRQEIAQLLDSEYSFSVTVKALDMALYRARLKRKRWIAQSRKYGKYWIAQPKRAGESGTGGNWIAKSRTRKIS